MSKQKVDDARVHLWTIAGSSLFESLPMNENGSHDVSELPKENLKAGPILLLSCGGCSLPSKMTLLKFLLSK
jgi:hypothetical protein